MQRWALAVVLASTLIACGGATEEGVIGEAVATAKPDILVDPPQPVPPDRDPEAAGQAPNFLIVTDLTKLELTPYTVCWSTDSTGFCSDGMPDASRNVVATDGELTVTYGDGDLTARLVVDGQDFSPGLSGSGDTWTVDLDGLAAGDYVLNLDWTGPQGDAHGTLTLRLRSDCCADG